jgi:hypothetical protein
MMPVMTPVMAVPPRAMTADSAWAVVGPDDPAAVRVIRRVVVARSIEEPMRIMPVGEAEAATVKRRADANSAAVKAAAMKAPVPATMTAAMSSSMAAAAMTAADFDHAIR